MLLLLCWPWLLGLVHGLAQDRLFDALVDFNANWDALFEQHVFMDSIAQGVQKETENDMNLEEVDFEKYVEEASLKFNDFFNGKVKAVKDIVAESEKVTPGVDFYQTWAQDELDCYEYQSKINQSDMYIMDLASGDKKSGVHVNVEAFKCDQAVLRDFEWTGKPEMEKVFVNNLAADSAIQRQYVGTYSGLTRVYPAFRWIAEPSLLTIDLFDPRFRPWFVTAETTPKDVLFLLDYGSVKGQTLHLIKMTVMYILTTLTPNDYFNAIWYNSKHALLLSSCAGENFLPATTRNKRLFQNMMDKVEEKDQASLPSAINLTFAQFVSIRIFGFSMGYGTGNVPALKWIACETDAVHSLVDSIADVRMQSRSYLNKLNRPLAEELASLPPSDRPTTFSHPYMDAQGEGAVITISAPILNLMSNHSEGGFLGVAAVDVTLESMRTLMPSSEQAYFFVMDNNGVVYYHPAMKLPQREIYAVRRTACHNVKARHRTGTRVQYGPADERVRKLMGLIDSIFTLDILELETEHTDKFRHFRDLMIKGDCRVPIDDGNRQYRCAKIRNTPLSVGFVMNKDKSTLVMANKLNEYLLEEHELVGHWIRQSSLCSEFLSQDDPLEQYEALMDLAQKESTCMAPRHQNMVVAFNRLLRDWSQKWPYLEPNSSCEAAANPPAFSLHFKTAFVETVPGVLSFYPKCQHKSVLHFFEDQPQLLDRAQGAGTRVRMDPFSHHIITFRPISDAHTGRALVLAGVIWDRWFFSELWEQVRESDDRWADCQDQSRKCLLLTNDFFVVASNQPKSAVHLSVEEPELLDELVERKLAAEHVRRDFQAECGITDRRYDTVKVQSPGSRALTLWNMLWYSLTTEAKPYYEDQACHFMKSEFIEQCTVEEKYFLLSLTQKTELDFKKDNCKAHLTVMPSVEKRLHLFVIEGQCESKGRRAQKLKEKYEFRPYRLPDCNQTDRRFRIRPPVIFTDKYEIPQTGTCSAAFSTVTTHVFILLLGTTLTFT